MVPYLQAYTSFPSGNPLFTLGRVGTMEWPLVSVLTRQKLSQSHWGLEVRVESSRLGRREGGARGLGAVGRPGVRRGVGRGGLWLRPPAPRGRRGAATSSALRSLPPRPGGGARGRRLHAVTAVEALLLT